ncbi:PXA domain-containing protein [Radiomyces spectabilis]|uniref:PXA domain-containing protein n=1 Tax=Radiomyces spectabilis TaxID=64574 RepID=UPI00221F4D78|nr:PXA domain-containing protein [Radiomyces spectabilis]KAI8390819.1 PXA domain-containing protein [Radiomyces spectabilis]
MSDSNVTTSLRLLHIRVLSPYLLTLPKSDPRRSSPPPSITGSPAIDLELYTYFALLIRDFINPWYRLVTNDQDLCTEIVSLLTLVVQRIQKRMCDDIDWTELLLISVPKLLTLHYQDYRQAKSRLHMDHASGSASLGELFHGMQPHFALQPVPNQEAEYLRLLTASILKVLLDPKDYESDAVRHLMREILSNVVLANLIESLADPYTIHMIICKLCENYADKLDNLESTGQMAETYFSAVTNETESSSQQTSSPAPDDSVTSIQAALIDAQNQQLMDNTPPIDERTTTKKEGEGLSTRLRRLKERQNELPEEEALEDVTNEERTHKRRPFSFGYITLQLLLAPIRSLWLSLTVLFTNSQERYQKIHQHKKRTRHMRLVEPSMQFMRIAFLLEDRPILQWAWQMIAMFVWPLVRVFGGGVLVDKFLELSILHVLSEDHIAYYLRCGRDLLWPDGVFLRKADPSTPLQREYMRVRAERLLTASLPLSLVKVLFDTTDLNEIQSHIHATIEPLQNKYINKHLLYLLVDLVASKIIPELVQSDFYP